MRLTPEQLAEWKALVPKLNDDSNDHMGVAHSADMPPDHTVNYRHARNAEEAAFAITALIADLEEAQRRISISEAFAKELSSELITTRKQLAEAQALVSQYRNALLDGPENTTLYVTEQLEGMGESAALDAAIAEAIEPYRKDAERFQELLSRLGDDSGLTIVKIEGWPDEYPGYACFADLPQEQVIAELDTAIAVKGESE